MEETILERRKRELREAMILKHEANLEYIAMMAGIDIPVDEEPEVEVMNYDEMVR